MSWRVSSIISERQAFCELASTESINFSVLCKRFSISRQTGYKWLKRYRDEGLAGLCDRSRRPGSIHQQTSAPMTATILDLRSARSYLGARKIRVYLCRQFPEDDVPSVSTISRILKRNGFIRDREAAVTYPTRRFERPFPNDLWQMDFKGPIRLPDGRQFHLIGVLDDHSRYLLHLEAVVNATDNAALDSWIAAARFFGLPNETLTDHGVQFRIDETMTSSFCVHLWACDVRHTQGRVGHPQTQGKIERLWRTLNTEVLRRHKWSNVSSWQSCIDDWREEYNSIRPHQSLGDVPPESVYRRSDRQYIEPDRHLRIGKPESQYRKVTVRGQITICGKRLMIGRGLAGWTVEARPVGNGCWHIYFRNHLIKEYVLNQPVD